jgi:hypothetical protein
VLLFLSSEYLQWKVMCIPLHFWGKGCLHLLGDSLIHVDAKRFVGRKCVYIGKFSNILANQNYRKVRWDRSWTKPAEVKFQVRRVSLGLLGWWGVQKLACLFECKCVHHPVNKHSVLSTLQHSQSPSTRRVCSWTWHTSLNPPGQQTKSNKYAASS